MLAALAPATPKDGAPSACALAGAKSVHFPATPIVRLKGSLHREGFRFCLVAMSLDSQQSPPGEWMSATVEAWAQLRP